jgi:hypothetical protein
MRSRGRGRPGHLPGDLQSVGSAAGAARAGGRECVRQLAVGNNRALPGLDDDARWILPNSAFTSAPWGAAARHRQRSRQRVSRSRSAGGPVAHLRPGRRMRGSITDRHAPLETLDELGPVLGMAPAILEAIRPHLTLFGPSLPNAATLHPVVAAALAEISQSSVRSFPEPATFRHADDADCCRRVWPEKRTRDPIRDYPSWRRAAQRLQNNRLRQWLLLFQGRIKIAFGPAPVRVDPQLRAGSPSCPICLH